ncbi:MAG: hypothetical protein JXB45_03610 [Candidatus Krumholzibacteriota bacterium]|nr:hypothetical protein [Candidatus Krumholzibacteriota bacterium]
MKRGTTILVLALIFLPGGLLAQGGAGESNYREDSVFDDYLNGPRGSGFLRLPGLQFHSSMGFSYFSSAGYRSQGMGYYLGHFNYRLSSSWTLNCDVGISSSLAGEQAGENPQLFLPNLDLTYRPSDKFLVRFQYQQHNYYHPFYLRPRF